MFLSNRTRVLIFGSFINWLPEKQGKMFIQALRKLLETYTITFVDAGGIHLSDYLHVAVKLHCMGKIPMGNEREYIESYRPSPAILMKQVEAESRHELADFEIKSMMHVSTPSLAICIGGRDQYNEKLWDICEEQKIPLIGTPFYQGTGLDSYNILLEKIKNKDPDCFPATVERYGDAFYKALLAMKEHNVEAFIQTISMALAETRMPV